MPDNTLVWCTESVDNSAMFLSQSLDATMTKKNFEDVEQDFEMVNLLQDSETNIIFYGLVKMPDWFTSEFYDDVRMFNDPRKCRKLLNRADVMDNLRVHGIGAVKYIPVKNKTWTYIRDTLHTSLIDLVKADGTLVATVENATDYNNHLGGIKYACKHVDAVGRYRVYVGRDHLVTDGVICFSSTEKKKLSYKETLMLNQSGDVKAALETMFDDGLITEDEDKGVEAWSETKLVSEQDTYYEAYFKNLSSKLISIYGVDFCAVDVVKLSNGESIVTNTTSSPSIQETEVLEEVSSYFSDLVSVGRKITKEKLVSIVSGLAEDDVLAVAQFLKGVGKLTKTA